MRILVVTQYFWPENFRINDLCAELFKRGHEVTVLTGKPNYPDGEFFAEYLEHPEKFSRYEGCDVVRVPMTARGKGSSLRLILNYLSYALSATFIGNIKLRDNEFDCIFVYEPSPITVGLPAILFKKTKNIPIVLWVLDLWPETLSALGVVKSRFILGAVGKMVSFIYRHCDMVLGQSKAFLSGIEKYCHDKDKVHYFPNWSEDIFQASESNFRSELTSHQGVFKVLFAGNIGEAQDFPSIIAAAQLAKERSVKVGFFVVGDGRMLEWVRTEVSRRQLDDYVFLLGRHPLESMPSFYASADALLVSLKESPIFSMTIPGKLQSYMVSGKPVLTMLSGEGSRVVEEAGCGFTANSGDSEKLLNNIVKLSALSLEDRTLMGTSAIRYSEKEFDRQKLVNKLENWMIELSLKKEQESI